MSNAYLLYHETAVKLNSAHKKVGQSAGAPSDFVSVYSCFSILMQSKVSPWMILLSVTV